MVMEGRHPRTLGLEADGKSVGILAQPKLAFRLERLRLTTAGEMAHAISSMQVRGAPLIGAAGAYGLALALAADPSDAALGAGYDHLVRSRPTAINLKWALDRLAARGRPLASAPRAQAAFPQPP